MERKNLIIWWYSIQFLSTFKTVQYDSVSLPILLLRDFQKYMLRHYEQLPKPKLNQKSQFNIQSMCQPYLIDSNPRFIQEGYTLIRSNMFSITEGINDQKFIYLAHHKKEYMSVKKHLKSRLFFYMPYLPEAKIAVTEEIDLLTKLNKILNKKNTYPYFKEKKFQSWLMKKTKKTLILIRKIHALFERYPINRTIYGSTINRHGALITTFAQTRNIFTINVQHGIFGELGHLPINADLNLVWGEADINYLHQFGAPKDKFRRIGPYFFRQSTLFQTRMNSEISQKKRRIQILVALQPLGFLYNKKMITTIEKAAEPFSLNLAINYKLHPDQNNLPDYNRLLLNNHSKLITDGKVNLHELIHSSDLIITPFSTVAFEAILYDKPIVFYGKKHKLYYLKGDNLYIHHLSSVKKIFENILNNPSFLFQLKKKNQLKDTHHTINDQEQLWKIIKQTPFND